MSQYGPFQNDWDKFRREIRKYSKLITLALGAIFTVITLATSFYTVAPEEEAVVIRLGRYLETTPPGLHFKLPFGIDREIKVKTKQILQAEFGFRSQDFSSRRTRYSQEDFDDESLMLTGDLNVADVEWVVQYQVADPFKFLFQTSSPETNIRDVSESIMRRVVGDRSVTEVLTTGRVEISQDARDLMQEVLDRYDLGVRIVTVKLQDVNPPDKVKPSFNEVNAAKQEQEQVINQAEERYNKVIPEARGNAQKMISEAEGHATRVVNRALGDAEKFNEIYNEYRKAPNLTRRRIYLETMEKLFNRFEDVTIVDPNVKGLLPVFGGQRLSPIPGEAQQ